MRPPSCEARYTGPSGSLYGTRVPTSMPAPSPSLQLPAMTAESWSKRTVAAVRAARSRPDFRTAARQLLERHAFVVVAEAETGISGIAQAKEHRPDLVLLDVQLPDIDGFEVAERLSRLDVPVEVILTSSLDGTDFGALVARSSALGFVPKAELSASAIEALLAPTHEIGKAH